MRAGEIKGMRYNYSYRTFDANGRILPDKPETAKKKAAKKGGGK